MKEVKETATGILPTLHSSLLLLLEVGGTVLTWHLHCSSDRRSITIARKQAMMGQQ
jgi:hypothetical protein